MSRKGVFVGAYIPNELKVTLQQRAKTVHRTVSQEIEYILSAAVFGRPPRLFIELEREEIRKIVNEAIDARDKEKK